jgi:hypothetical protein
MVVNNQITAPRVAFLDKDGRIAREWYLFLYNLYTIVGTGTGVIPVTSGGTGLTTIPTNGQLLIGNGTGYTLNTLGAGSGISVANGSGTITVANTGVLSNIAGTGISVSGATGNVTIANTGVLSFSGGTTGLTPVAAAVGVVVLGGTLIAANGGTGFASYAVGDLLYADTTTTLAKLADVATGNALISGGVSTAPSWGKIGLTTHVDGVLPIANGGTNGTATPTANGVSYGTGSAYAFTAAGTTGQILTATTGSAPTWAAPATSGTVTSVGLSLPAQFTVTNSPVTSSGTLTGSWNTQTANFVLAGPTAGAAAVPTFRALVAADIPALPYGTGDVVGPASATDNAVARYDLTTGKLIQNSLVIVDDTGSVTGVNSLTAKSLTVNDNSTFGTSNSDTINFVGRINSDFDPATDNTYDLGRVGHEWRDLYIDGTANIDSLIADTADINGGTIDNTTIGATTPQNGSFVDLSVTGTLSFDAAQGTSGQVLTSAGTGVTPTWTTPTTGTVTAVSVVSANGLAGTVATATTTPAITLSTSITGILKGNGTAISAATSGTDYAPATSGTSILYGNGSGGFSNVTVGSGLSFAAGTLASTASAPSAPVTQTANFTVAATDVWSINNKSGSTCTVTLPTPSTNSGRVLYFQNYQAQALVSASSNVVPLAGGAAATSILLASSGDSATLVSDGTNWLMTQYISNNNLLLG